MVKKILFFSVIPLLVFSAGVFILVKQDFFLFDEIKEPNSQGFLLEDDELVRSFDSTFRYSLFRNNIVFSDSLIEREPGFWIKNYEIPANMPYPRILKVIRDAGRGYKLEIINTYLDQNETIMNVVVGQNNRRYIHLVFSNTSAYSKNINIAVLFFNFGYGDLADELQILRLPLKLNIAVAPFFNNSDQVVAESVQRGHELLIYMPMEPKFHPVLGGNAQNIKFSNYLEKHGILVTHPQEVINQRLRLALDHFSSAKVSGITNFKGFKVIRSNSIMNTVVEYANNNNLYFLYKESLEYSGISDIEAMSNEAGGFVSYDFFIDNQNNPDAIRETFERAVANARRTGNAVVIAQPYKNTYDFFNENLKRFEEEGIDFIFITSLVNMR